MFIILYSISWPNFIVWLPSWNIQQYICIAIVCFPGCGVVNFEINYIFLIQPFFYIRSIAEKFNEFYVNVGPNLAKKIPQSDINFETNLRKVNATLKESSLTENELEEAVKSLKKNKASGPDGLDVNIIISVNKIIKRPLLKIFNDSLLLGIFPQTM